MPSNSPIEQNSVNIQAQKWASSGSAGVFANPERYTVSSFTVGNNFTLTSIGVFK
jgi:hypothetical protein